MTTYNTYKLSEPGVVHQEIEGEVIVVDLQKGYYYSLTGTAVPIWKSLLRGCDAAGVGRELSGIYSGDREEMLRGVTDLAEALAREGLLSLSSEPPVPPEEVSAEKIPFAPPQFQKYTDMEDVLVLDPIHDVDESGWPNAKKV